MLDKKKGFNLSSKTLRNIGILAVIFLVVIGGYLFINRDRGVIKAPDSSVAGAGAVQVKSTAFDGEKINVDDPQALRAYCDDLFQNSQSSGNQIRDLCVLNDIVREFLPTLSNEQIEDLASNQPTCLQTGYDSEGFNCFTGMDQNNCSKEGLDNEGNICNPEIARIQPVEVTSFEFDEAKICSIVSGCQAESEFDENGMNRFGCNREGRREDGTMCPAEYITRIYGDDQLDQLGFTPDGFNEFGCDIQGLRANGDVCPLEQVTRVFDRNNFDQWGFTEEGYNKHGCSFEGLDREGKACPIENITRVIDPKTNRDQFGLDPDGFNEAGCGLDGYSRTGKLCAVEDMPLIWGKDGKNQFGLFKNNRNEFGCGIDGLDEEGLACDITQVPRLFSEKTGKDQFGFYKNNRNDAGCDPAGLRANGTICSIEDSSKIIGENGLDSNGISIDGFNSKGCNLKGFRRNGQRCSISEIPRIIDPVTGLDQFQLDSEGFHVETGCNLKGFDREGERCAIEDIPRIFDEVTGLDQFGISSDNYNEAGCDLNGLNRLGQVCDPSDITRIFDPITKLDQFGLDEDGFSPLTNCNLAGFDRQGVRCDFEDIPKIIGSNGVNQLGLTNDGRNAAGCDLSGIKENGDICTEAERTQLYSESGISQYHKNKDGFSRLGINDMQYNEFNCNIDGLRPDGSICPLDEIPRVFDPVTKLDQFGLNEDGFNEFGCSLEGKDVLGNACKPEHIPRIFSSEMKDQFGNHINDLPDEIWIAEQAKKAGLVPLLDENGNPVYKDGKAVMVARDGVLRDKNGVAFRDDNGLALSVTPNGEVTNSRGQVFPTSAFKDKDGVSVSGALTPGGEIATGNKRLISSDGEALKVYEEDAYVDEYGFLVDVYGDYITDENGELLRLDENGDVVSASGQKVSSLAIRNLEGEVIEGPFKTQKPKSLAKLSSLTSSNGEPVLIDGKPAYVDKNGNLTDGLGNVLLGEDGKPLSLNKAGDVVNSSGEKIDPRRITSMDGKKVSGPFKSAVKAGLKVLTNSAGETVMVDGRPAFVDENGVITDAQGNALIGTNGKPLRLSDNGEVVDSNGRRIRAERLKTTSGKAVTGQLHAVDKASRAILTDSQGNPVLIDGKAAFVDEDGNILDAQGEFMLGKNGTPLKLNKNGDVVDFDGTEVNAQATEIASDRITNIDGKKVSGPLKAAVKPGLKVLTNAVGDAVMIDGRPAYVDENGIVTDANGNFLRGTDGKPLRLNENGDVVDSKGNKIRASRMKDINGESFSGKVGVTDLKAESMLTDKDGNPILVDGKLAFLDKDGNVIDANGQLIRGADGKPLQLDSNGDLVDSLGRKISAERITDASGDIFTGELKESTIPSNKILTDAEGNPIFVDGKPAFLDENGNVVGADGKEIRGADGKPLQLNKDGKIVDSLGQRIDASRITKPNGDAYVGTFDAVDIAAKSVLTDAEGNPVFVDGKVAFLDENGNVVDEKGALLRGADGQPLRLNRAGDIVDASGKRIDANRLSKANGEPVKGKMQGTAIGDASLLTDSQGNPVLVDGKLAFVDKKGNVLDAKGNIIRGSDGKPLTLNKAGKIVSLDGIEIDAERLTSLDGKVAKKPLKSKNSLEQGMLVDANGESVLIDGEIAYVDEKGFIRDANGSLMLDSNGEPLTLNENNQVVDGKGKPISRDRLTTLDGGRASGLLSVVQSKSDEKFSPLIDENGNIAMLNDTPVMVNEDGNLVDANGDVIRGPNGEPLRLNEAGQVVNASGQVIPSSYFQKADGSNMEGVFGESSLLTPSQLEAAILAQKLTPAQRAALELSDDGYNPMGCALNGLDRNGKLCDFEDIPKIYDPVTKLDQFGFTEDGYNGFGCDIDGLNRNKEKCEDKFITRLRDADEFDQFGISPRGLKRSGLNANSENLLGCDAAGENCSELNSPLLTDGGGTSQFGQKENGADRLNLVNGFNAKGCNLDGLKASGERCAIEDIPMFYSIDGVNQFGTNPDGFNDNGCGFDGIRVDGSICELNEIPRIFDGSLYDQFNLNSEGRNAAGCNLSGFKIDGSRCEIEDIPLMYDKNGINQFGIGKDSFNAKGCNLKGYRADGSRCPLSDVTRILDPETGLDQFNMDEDGFNSKGCNLQGLSKDGELCAFEDVTRVFDDATGKDQFGFYEDGYNDAGCNYYGLDRNNEICKAENITRIVNEKGVDQLGIDSKTGLNKFGCDINGVKPTGERCKPSNQVLFVNASGKDRHGLINGMNENECSIEGFKPDGSVCKFEEITQVVDEETGKNQWGLNPDGTNEHGCNLDGIGKDGEPCPLENITHIFGEDGKDHLNLDKNGRNVFDCNLLGFKPDGTRCSHDELTRIRGNSGKDQLEFFDDGFNEAGEDMEKYDRSGCDVNNRNRQGELCAKTRGLGLDLNDGTYIAERKAKLATWLAAVSQDMAYQQPVKGNGYSLSLIHI